jgi:catechol 2,3-dioxygenase-like lactoylglutathione lyase family enzyme
MNFISLRPFIPSGLDYEKAKAFFTDLGFEQKWDMGDYAGFENNQCAFILQRFDNRNFAENLMITVGVPDAAAFSASMLQKQLPQQYGISIGAICEQPYGLEVNIIDLAGVCWHFVQAID